MENGSLLKTKATVCLERQFGGYPRGVSFVERAWEGVMKDAVDFSSLTQFDPKGDSPFSFTSLCLLSYISQHFKIYMPYNQSNKIHSKFP